jgi:hypothetical protein
MRINLEKFGGRARIGSAAKIRISGEGVMPVHAELTAHSRAGASIVELRAVGDVWVIRGTLRRLLTPNEVWNLADNDRFEIGSHTFRYDNLDSFISSGIIDADVRRATTWLTQ